MSVLVRTIATVLAAAFLAAGCSLFPSDKDETAGWTPERIYKSAHDAMIEGNYTRAVKLFESLEARFPYGRYAQQAMLEGAYANYRANETAAAIDVQGTTANLNIRENVISETRGAAKRVGIRIEKDAKDIALAGNRITGFATDVEDRRAK